MKFLFCKNVSAWNMTGILSTGARWFFGFSRFPKTEEVSDTWVLSSEYDAAVKELTEAQEEVERLKSVVAVNYLSKEEINSLFPADLDSDNTQVNGYTYHSGQQYVVCAAARNTYNGAIICSPRHYDSTFHAAIELYRETADEKSIEGWRESDEGFVDQFGKFLTRAEARKIAVATNQIRRRCGGDHEELYSENLY